MTTVLGFEGKLTIGNFTPGFKNLRFGYSHTEVDTTTNLDLGNKSYVKGLFDKFIGADLQIDDSEACIGILNIISNRNPVTVTAELGDITISGLMHVFGSEISADLDNAASITITCRPAPANNASGS